MALARRKIAEGQVPRAEDFVIEGLSSEHDLPLEGPPCEDRQEVFVQVGMSSHVDPATFRRKPLDAALVIDHSGSMQGEAMWAGWTRTTPTRTSTSW